MTAPRPSQDNEPITLLAAADDAYALPLAVTLFSALEQLSSARAVKIYVFDGGIGPTKRQRIERVLSKRGLTVQLEWLTPDPQTLAGLPLGSGEVAYLSQAMYLRLFAAHLIPEAKVIYLDSDMLVQDSLEKVWTLDLTPYAAAAVPERTNMTLGQALPEIVSRNDRLDPDAPYYNSGMLVINLAWWRTEKVAESAFAFIRDHTDIIRYPDQDALNVVLQGAWLTLDRRWNIQANSVDLRLEPTPPDEAFVLHYSTKFKPWLKLAFGLERPYFGRYLHALKRSGWFSTREYTAFYARLALDAASKIPAGLASRLTARQSHRP